jgi:hypothetical protein
MICHWKVGKEKEQDMIEVIYQIVIEYKEKLKIKEIKSFINELSSFSSFSLQRPNIITSLGQIPV